MWHIFNDILHSDSCSLYIDRDDYDRLAIIGNNMAGFTGLDAELYSSVPCVKAELIWDGK
jgi:hypothetical protein